jgi:hypothetical protein
MRARGRLFPDPFWARSLTTHERTVPIHRLLVTELLTDGSNHVLAFDTKERHKV